MSVNRVIFASQQDFHIKVSSLLIFEKFMILLFTIEVDGTSFEVHYRY